MGCRAINTRRRVHRADALRAVDVAIKQLKLAQQYDAK
jgi:hypothetical protein